MVFSFLLPFMVLAARPLHGVPLLGALGPNARCRRRPLLPVYALHFALGVVTFREQKPLARVYAAIPSGMATPMLLAAFFLQAMPLLLGWSVPMVGLHVAPRDPASVAMMSVGAWGLVSAATFLAGPRRLLSIAPLVAAGRISF